MDLGKTSLGNVAFLVLLALCSVCYNPAKGEGWGYGNDDDGPATWATHYSTCAMDRQSPIDLNSPTEAETDAFKLVGGDKVSGELKNSGHSVQFTFDTMGALAVSGGDLPGTYKAAQFHFHWGSSSNVGSEHVVDGKQYAGEMHVVMVKSPYASITAALDAKKGDGLAVLGFLLEESSAKNEAFDKVIDGLTKTIAAETATKLTDVDVRAMMSDDLTKFYRYLGSLTTPNCAEEVVWTIFSDPVPLSANQFAQLRTLKAAGGSSLVDNFRPVQALNARKITLYQTPEMPGSASSLHISMLCSIITVLAIPVLPLL